MSRASVAVISALTIVLTGAAIVSVQHRRHTLQLEIVDDELDQARCRAAAAAGVHREWQARLAEAPDDAFVNRQARSYESIAQYRKDEADMLAYRRQQMDW